MLLAIFISLAVTAALGVGLRSGNGLITRRGYNNRYNDASGARDDSYS